MDMDIDKQINDIAQGQDDKHVEDRASFLAEIAADMQGANKVIVITDTHVASKSGKPLSRIAYRKHGFLNSGEEIALMTRSWFAALLDGFPDAEEDEPDEDIGEGSE